MEKPLSYPNQQISIHVPSWGTTRSLFDLPFPLPISIHVPSWGTTSMLAGCGKAYPFQSTFPRGERRFLRGGSRLVSYFNPRSLVGNDEQAEARQWQHAISIHVPSWGTTACTSIETGVDLFQSTFPRGERRQLRKILHKTKQISIHVPSWGTTQCLANTRRMRLFQSTFPRGERRRRWICSTEEGNFNPRSLVGNDRRLRQDIRLLGISIHVPSWGTTCTTW